MTETWSEMTARHKRERRELVTRLAEKRLTQTQAARRLGVPLTCLNNFLLRNQIPWVVIAQGPRKGASQ